MKKKILLIEDDPDHAELITELLLENRNSDFEKEVILKRDGKEAVDYLKELDNDVDGMRNHVDLVLLDINLPKINGMGVLKLLKGNSLYSKIPVVVLSTSPDQKTIASAYDNGADEFVQKTALSEGFAEALTAIEGRWLKASNFSAAEACEAKTDRKVGTHDKCNDSIKETVKTAEKVTNQMKEIANISTEDNENEEHSSNKRNSGSD